jgi:hypothetical protein
MNENSSLKDLTAHLRDGGPLWGLKGQDGTLADAHVRVDLHHQFASHFPIKQEGRRTALTSKRVAIETDSGEVLAVVAGGPAAHYPSEYREFDGIMVPTKRRVYALAEDGTADWDLLLVTIDLDGITFE